MAAEGVIDVVVAAIVNESDEVCISLRHADSHQGGLWEFPGGKIEHDESIEQALNREIREELGVEIKKARPLIKVCHDYSDKSVCLHVYKVSAYNGVAHGLEGQQVKWLPLSQLATHDFPAANQAIIKSLLLPSRYLITGRFDSVEDFLERLSNALDRGIRLVQLRLKNGSLKSSVQLQPLLEQASILCRRQGAKLMLNIGTDYLSLANLESIEYAGFHADSKTLNAMSTDSSLMPGRSATETSSGKLLSASCHNADELSMALQLNADFLVLSAVQKTASHPDMEAMGWPRFASMIESLTIPVFALGGVGEQDLETAWLNGAQGVAAISAFW